KKRLKELAAYIQWYRELYKADPEGEVLTIVPRPKTQEREEGETGSKANEKSGEQTDDGLQPASEHLRRRGSFPEFDWVNGGTSKNRGELSQRCARYDRQMHKLFLNAQFEGIDRAVEMIAAEFQHAHDQAALRADAI